MRRNRTSERTFQGQERQRRRVEFTFDVRTYAVFRPTDARYVVFLSLPLVRCDWRAGTELLSTTTE